MVAGSAIVVGASSGAQGSVLVPTVPERALDTREADSPIGTFGAETTATLSFAGMVPVDATAVELNITTTGGTDPSFLSAYPSG
jgi:hypothetical protein